MESAASESLRSVRSFSTAVESVSSQSGSRAHPLSSMPFHQAVAVVVQRQRHRDDDGCEQYELEIVAGRCVSALR